MPASITGLGDQNFCAIAEGELHCWGNNGYGQLGLGDNNNGRLGIGGTTDQLVPTLISSANVN